jgi:YVTN family beta-propeller protein
VPNLGSNTLSRIDPATNKVVNTLSVGTKPFPAANAFGDIWVAERRRHRRRARAHPLSLA